MWLWEALFRAEKDAFPGVYPQKKLPARSTGNAPNTNTVTAANNGMTNNTNQTVAAAHIGVTNNTTAACAVSGTPTPKISPSTGGPSPFASTSRAAHANTGSQAKMEVKNKPAQVPTNTTPNPQNRPVPNNPGRFTHSSPPMLHLVGGYPQFVVKSRHKHADIARKLFLGLKGEAVREVQGKLRARLRCLEVDDNQLNKKALVFYAEPFERKDENNAEVLYKCLAAWKLLTMWMGRYTEKVSPDYLHHYYSEWEKISQGGEEITHEEWAKYVSLNPSLAGFKTPNKKPASVNVPSVASTTGDHHAKEYQKVRRKVIEKYKPTSEEQIKSLIQRDFKWNLISQPYVQKSLTE
jgi:hypothetical protein